jgi:hypothetical protein
MRRLPAPKRTTVASHSAAADVPSPVTLAIVRVPSETNGHVSNDSSRSGSGSGGFHADARTPIVALPRIMPPARFTFVSLSLSLHPRW